MTPSVPRSPQKSPRNRPKSTPLVPTSLGTPPRHRPLLHRTYLLVWPAHPIAAPCLDSSPCPPQDLQPSPLRRRALLFNFCADGCDLQLSLRRRARSPIVIAPTGTLLQFLLRRALHVLSSANGRCSPISSSADGHCSSKYYLAPTSAALQNIIARQWALLFNFIECQWALLFNFFERQRALLFNIIARRRALLFKISSNNPIVHGIVTIGVEVST